MQRAQQTIGNRIAPLRFIAFAVLLPLGFCGWRMIEPSSPWQDSLAMGFDLAAAAFLLSLVPILRHFSVADMRRHARDNDANRTLLLLITSALAVFIMIAISGELAPARQGNAAAMVKLLATLALTWLFANAVYALHYAHSYYFDDVDQSRHRGGIEFPGNEPPDYRDFAYFAYTLGMTFQTSDVAITAPEIRRVVLVHSLVAFAFNIGVIAFTINALG